MRHGAVVLGQDALLVHDEAHLEPAFQELVESIQDVQAREPAPVGQGLRLKLLALTATPRNIASGTGGTFGLNPNDRADPEVRRRVHAAKTIDLIPCEEEQDLANRLADRALLHQGSGHAVLVFARSVEDVGKVAERLSKAKQQVVKLTGTLRGKERDDLVKQPIFRRFLPGAEGGEGTVYLISTSAGEVGVNMSADHMVCDLSTFESMAQRLGRVNRFGDREDTRVDIVHPVKFDQAKPYEQSRVKTLALLRQLDGDGSPDALSRLDPQARRAGFGPPPGILPASDILFDTWALTTIRGRLPGRPPVEPYLRGVSDQERPETRVAWREEVGVFTNLGFTEVEIADQLDRYPLKPHEILRDRSDRVLKEIAARAKKHPMEPAWLLRDDGSVRAFQLKGLAEKKGNDEIESGTILLVPSAGGLDGGLLDGRSDAADDVADDWFDVDGRRRRARLWGGAGEAVPDGMRLIQTIDTRPGPEGEAEDQVEATTGGWAVEEAATSGRRYWNWYERPKDADNDGSYRSCEICSGSGVAVPDR